MRLWTLHDAGVNSQVVTKPSKSITLRLQNKSGRGGKRKLGEITVHAEETVASRSAVEMVLRCSHLDNKDVFSKSVRIQYPPTFICYLLYLGAYLFV